MPIPLYPHNAEAYQSASAMLEGVGKAAVIHPTGTGKSFIGFKLCEDHPNRTVCWLSPSAHIFRTQVENLTKAVSGSVSAILRNVRFLTYAKLSLLGKEESGEVREARKSGGSGEKNPEIGGVGGAAEAVGIGETAGIKKIRETGEYEEAAEIAENEAAGSVEIAGIRPDYIILDEFHRCGAEQWGTGVRQLLAAYPEAKVLGLTATNVRYLDGQRDMAEELFDGNIASFMTLGEAIVRGILRSPRYVLSMFSFQKELEKYERRVQTAKSEAARQAAGEYLEAIRRKLENAEGLDRVFARHMPDKSGKYLVFCSGAEHMEEMMALVPEWFGKVDPEPRIYRAYAEDPATDQAFADFKADQSSHLKLLYCIDMLNEGVHVEDVSGVILLRPTASPIVYKQQIGRALSAGCREDAVIFDIVRNIDSLYSIGTIQEEMQAAITYYHYLGQSERIINECFRILDETHDCRRLFAELEQKLDASWDLMLAEARKYYEAHGNLQVPAKYKTSSGLSLGSWLNVQRKIYQGKAPGFLTEQQIAALDGLGIVWDSYLDRTWEKNFLAAKAYRETYGNLLVPAKYKTEEGFPLGEWISRMRSAKANERGGILTEERIRKLEGIDMIWDARSSQWEANYREAAAYYREHGDLLVPGKYVSSSGIKLGNWISHLRILRRGKGKGTLTEEQIARLDRIGMAWNAEEERWKIGYGAAKAYLRAHGDLNVPFSYETEGGYGLGRWIHQKRRQYRKGTLTLDQIRDLERLGIRWDAHGGHWQEMYDEAKSWYRQNGNLKVPRQRLTAKGHNLNLWICRMRRERDRLSREQVSMLAEIGM